MCKRCGRSCLCGPELYRSEFVLRSKNFCDEFIDFLDANPVMDFTPIARARARALRSISCGHVARELALRLVARADETASLAPETLAVALRGRYQIA